MAETLRFPTTGPIRVVIAGDYGLMRAGLRVLLESGGFVRVVAEAATGDEAVGAARLTRPDVVVIDGDLEATRRIRSAECSSETRVVVLLASDSAEAVFAALRAGATGLLLKDSGPGELLQAVRVVAGGEAALAPQLARWLVADLRARPERPWAIPEELEDLTERECEVVALVACGLSNDEIAKRLAVTRATAKTHVSRALWKLGVRDRAQLVALAYETGLVP